VGVEAHGCLEIGLKPLRQLANGRPLAIRIALDVQEQQILQLVMPSPWAACSEKRSKRRIW
jgi:hypothetical protein